MAIALHGSFAVHPGLWLRSDVVEAHGLTVTVVAAQKLHVTRQAMRNLLNGHAGLSADMAIRFEQAFCLSADTLSADTLSADTLLRMQAAHDLARARAKDIRVERVAA